jgi:hypothetical protein
MVAKRRVHVQISGQNHKSVSSFRIEVTSGIKTAGKKLIHRASPGAAEKNGIMYLTNNCKLDLFSDNKFIFKKRIS